jgi:hypothetical protein
MNTYNYSLSGKKEKALKVNKMALSLGNELFNYFHDTKRLGLPELCKELGEKPAGRAPVGGKVIG